MHNILRKKYFDGRVSPGLENISNVLECRSNWLRPITLCKKFIHFFGLVVLTEKKEAKAK